MSKKLIFHLQLIVVLLFVNLSLTAGEYRSKNRFGVYFAIHEPAPGSAGLNLAYNFFPFLRLHGGLSVYSNASDRVGDEFGSAMMAAMTYMLLLGQVGYTDIREFYDEEFDKKKIKYILARGLGVKLFHPTWKISPFAGVSYNKQSSKNHPYDLKDSNTYFTYSLGIDYQMAIGFHFSVGFKYSPELPDSAERRVYASSGFFF